MKTYFKFIIVTVLAVMTSLTSCDNNDPDDNSPGLDTLILDCNSFKSNNPDAILVLENRNNTVDYIIDCVVSVSIDLKIEPGVVIQYADAAGMKIETSGSISAVGSQSQGIVFTAETKTKGAWKGVLSYSESVKNRFDYVTIEYAGGGSFNSNGDLGSLILWADAYFRLNNVTIQNGLSNGINARYAGYDVELNNCTITGCEVPAYIGTNIASRISGGDFTGNTIDALRLKNNKIETSQTWKVLSVPYRITGIQGISNGAVLTIEPGVIVEFEDGQGMKLQDFPDQGEALIAVGTPTNPIIFTGVTKMPGAWKSIYFTRSSSPQNNISHVVFEYAGGGDARGAIEMWANAVVNVSNSTFKDISTCAIYDFNGPNPFFSEGNNTTENVSGGYLCGN